MALLYWALIPLGMNWYRDHFGFTAHRDIGLGIAQFHLFWMFIGAQLLIAVLRPLFAAAGAGAAGVASWTLMHDHPLRLVYFTVGPGLLALAAIAASLRYSSRATSRYTTDTTDARRYIRLFWLLVALTWLALIAALVNAGFTPDYWLLHTWKAPNCPTRPAPSSSSRCWAPSNWW